MNAVYVGAVNLMLNVAALAAFVLLLRLVGALIQQFEQRRSGRRLAGVHEPDEGDLDAAPITAAAAEAIARSRVRIRVPGAPQAADFFVTDGAAVRVEAYGFLPLGIPLEECWVVYVRPKHRGSAGTTVFLIEKATGAVEYYGSPEGICTVQPS